MSGKVIGNEIEYEEIENNEENTSFNSEDSNTNAEEFNIDLENEKV